MKFDMKIKIIPRWETKVLYNVYHGFTSYVFFTKWMLAKEGLNMEELEDYLRPFMFGLSPNGVSKIEITVL